MVEVTPAAVSDFLFHEADLLDGWQLMKWAELFTDDAHYLVPSTEMPEGAPDASLYLIYDDRHRLGERAKRLLSKSAHAEFPHSRTCHMISNVRIIASDADLVRVTCNFAVHRSKREVQDVFPGRSEYELIPGGPAGFRIRFKKATLALEALRPHGKLSIIL